MLLGKNLKYLRKSKQMTQESLSDQLGIKRTMISAYEDGRSEPKLSALKIICDIFSVSLDELLYHDIALKGRKATQKKDIKILTISLDQEENENITMVPQKASAGYLNGFADPEYLKELPQFHLPNLSKNTTYRAFEINGDSMLPLVSGTVVIGAYIEQLADIKSGRTYILVTESEGVVYKRVFNYLEENGKLFLVSDNDIYKPYEISGDEVNEIWEAKAFISTDFPNPRDKSKPTSLDDIAEMIMELKHTITKSR